MMACAEVGGGGGSAAVCGFGVWAAHVVFWRKNWRPWEFNDSRGFVVVVLVVVYRVQMLIEGIH